MECPATQQLDPANFSQTAHTLAENLRRYKRRLATSPSRNNGLVLSSVRSTSSARRFTVPRIESSVASEDAKSNQLGLISMI